MGFGSRLPNSNEIPVETQNRWGGNEIMDDFALKLNGDGKNCVRCKRVTQNCFLDDSLCPDCYPEVHDGQKSPALARAREKEMQKTVYCGSGQPGEAD